MDPLCAHLVSQDPDEALLCDHLLMSGTMSAADMDTGAAFVNFSGSAPYLDTLPDTAGNGIMERQEIRSAVVSALEEEESRAFQTSSFTAESFPFSNFVSQNTSIRVPWLLSTSLTGQNLSLMSELSSDVSSIKNKLISDGHSLNTVAGRRALAQSLIGLIMDADKLGVKNVPLASQEWTTLEVLTVSHEADCSEFSMLFYELCRIAGLDARMIEETVDDNGFNSSHMMIALRLDPNDADDITFVDLTRTDAIRSAPPVQWVPLPDISVIAYYHMNLGLKPPQNVVSSGAQARFDFVLGQYETAQDYDPNLPLVYINIGKLYRRALENDLADHYFNMAYALDPL